MLSLSTIDLLTEQSPSIPLRLLPDAITIQAKLRYNATENCWLSS